MSVFLPDDFDASRPLALIAGQGNYPILLTKRARKNGIQVRPIELGGETSPELIESFSYDKRSSVKVGQVGKLLKELKKFDAGYAVMAGQVTPGKLFKGLHPDLKAIRMLAGLDRKMRKLFLVQLETRLKRRVFIYSMPEPSWMKI